MSIANRTYSLDTTKPLSKMEIFEVIEAFRDYMDLYINTDKPEDDSEYIPIQMEEPPDFEGVKRFCTIEGSDTDCFGWDGKKEYVTIILSFYFDPGLITKDWRAKGESKTFMYRHAQSESRRLYKNLFYDPPHPFTGRLEPLTVSRIETTDDLLCYALPFRVFIS